MKKFVTLFVALAMLLALAVPASAAYVTKVVELIANDDGTASLPEGVEVYVGDTIIVPRKMLIRIGEYVVEETNETVTEAAGFVGSFGIYQQGKENRLASVWADMFEVSSLFAGEEGSWIEKNADMTPGTYVIRCDSYKAVDTKQSYKQLSEEVELITFEVKDPADYVEPVVSEEPVSSEAPVESTEAPVESTEAPVESEAPAASVDATVSDVDTTPNNTLLWVLIAIGGVVVVLLVVLIAKKKK